MADKKTVCEVLIVESVLSVAIRYQRNLARAGIVAEYCQTLEEALLLLKTGRHFTVILDPDLKDGNGIDVIQKMEATNSSINLIVTTAKGSINMAVDSMRAGAFDFLIKPFPVEKLLKTVRSAINNKTVSTPIHTPKQTKALQGNAGFIGESEPMREVYKLIESVASSSAAVFITGESGTGKEVTAQAIHELSDRREAPFIALNCAALPEHLIESEIFGHIKGAFTGANQARAGAASMANGGTLFLDEICEMDIALQAKLLRFLQTGHVKRVGSDWIEEVDVRIICATNRKPIIEVSEKRFREDLFYRLDVLTIELPQLSKRGGDIILLAEHFLQQYAAEEDKAFKRISSEARLEMLAYHWPGNVRELQNIIRKAVVIHDGVELELHMLTFKHAKGLGASDDYNLIGLVQNSKPVTPMDSLKKMVPIDVIQPMIQIEKQIIEAVISSCNGSIPKASQILQLSPSTIYRKREGWIKDDLEKQYKAS